MKKIIISAIFCLLLFGGITASAATYGNLTYTVSNGEITITDCKESASGEVVIPEKINGYMVTSIGEQAFSRCSSLTSITIPDSVTSIGNSAFSRCDSLTSITIPDGVTSIGHYAFFYCDSLTSITIPDGVTSIGNSAFYDCSSLTSITIPDSVTSIGDSAFRYCGSLTSITIPDSVTSIGDYAFCYCSSLTSITILDGVTSIGDHAFKYCSSLTSITIPDSVTSIGNAAFYGCSSLTSITIPDSVTSIGNSAFSGCSSLTSITIPDSVTSIGNDAFYGCSSLISITIPDSVTSIGDRAFSGCRSLTSITIPDSVTSIGYSTFSNCDSLKVVHILDMAAWCNIVFNGNDSNPLAYAEKLYLNGAMVTELVIPDSVISIGNYAFFGYSSLTSITIPDSVTSIGYSAFSNCDSLTGINVGSDNSNYSSVDGVLFNKTQTVLSEYPKGKTNSSYSIPDSVTSIRNSAFFSCSSLTSITIPDSVTSIGYAAFAGCSSLTSITIPDGVTSIGGDAFSGCSSLKTVYKPVSAKWSYGFNSSVSIVYTCKVKYNLDGEVISEEIVEQNENALLLTPPEGYTYTFTVAGKEWDGYVTGDVTVIVTKTPIKYTIKYTGDYIKTITADYASTVVLPSEYGYIYTFTADGEGWDGYVSRDMTVTVTKTPIKYTIKYIGEYTETITADYATTVTLPAPLTGYIYTFTANGKDWNGYVTGDLTVTVTKVCDLAEVVGIELDNVNIDGSNITGEWLWRVFDGEVTVSEGASYVIYDSKECINAVDSLDLSEQTEYFIKVTAESGREKIYTLNVTRSAPKTIGTLTIEQIAGGSLVMSVEEELPGKPLITIAYGEEMDSMTDFVLAEYDEVSGKLYAKGLPEDREYYFRVIACYDDIEAQSSIVLARTGITLSSDCYVIRTLTPPGGKIVHAENESGTGSISGLRVINSYESVEIDVEVSAGATWGLYRTKTSTTPIEKNISLTNYAGRSITRYIRVKSEDGEHERIYSIEIYRQSKSSEPEITLSGNKVTITALGETILYTTDKSVPGEENENTKIYTEPFEVSGGTVIKAIAKESDKDEYSNMVTYTLPARLEATIVPLDMFRSGKEYIYAFNVESAQEVSGEFILCLYDENGGLVATEIQSIDNEIEYCAEGVIVSDTVATDFKALLWCDMTSMTPLAEFADGKID